MSIVRACRQAGGPAHSAKVVAPTEPNVEADPFAPTEPDFKAQVLFTTADGLATSEPNAAVDIRATTADLAPTASPIAAFGSVAWPAAPRQVRVGPRSLRRVEGPKLGSPAAEAIAPTEANSEAQVSSMQAVVFTPTEPNPPAPWPAGPTEDVVAGGVAGLGRAGRRAQVFRLRWQRTSGGKVEIAVVLGITSLAGARAGAKELLGRIRGPWGFEHGRLGVRDGTLGEDAGALQNGSAPEVIAFRRSIPIVVFKVLVLGPQESGGRDAAGRGPSG